MTPEQALWLAVLLQAVLDLKDLNYRAKTIRWFRYRRNEPGDFNWICEALGWDSQEIREKVLNRHKGKKVRIVQRRRRA